MADAPNQRFAQTPFDTIETKIRQRMQEAGIDRLVIDDFIVKAAKVHGGQTGLVDFANIKNLNESEIINLTSLPVINIDDAKLRPLLEKTVIIKLNGGLGTSMGLTGPKTLLTVRDGKTFLDIILRQLHILRKKSGVSIPLLFMNSFSTNEATLSYKGIASTNPDLPVSFLQNKVPRLDAASLLPIRDGNDDDDWCPPGHGDIFAALQISGLLDRLLSKNIRYAFLSNGDNLGATLDPSILYHFAQNEFDFLSEVTPKTQADIKGGVLFRHSKTNRIELLETAQVPPENKLDFEDTKRFADFNINNLWIDLESLKARMAEGPLDLSMIVNPKTVDDLSVIQLECAMGAAIGQFENTGVVRVGRHRFAPVKNCSDLMVRRSDACIINDDGALVLHPDRHGIEPVVQLDTAYKEIDDFEALVPITPSLLHAASFRVKGAIVFDAPADIEGNVVLQNPSPKAISVTQLE